MTTVAFDDIVDFDSTRVLYDGTETSISYFYSTSVADSTLVTSYLDRNVLVEVLQRLSTDPYFDSTDEVNNVIVTYYHEGYRQKKIITYEPPTYTKTTSWSPVARDGVWHKYRIDIFNHNGASARIDGTNTGATEDLYHSSGIMYLNNV